MTRIQTALMAQGFGTGTKNIRLSGYISELTAMYCSAYITLKQGIIKNYR
jgi:hypothetical protein